MNRKGFTLIELLVVIAIIGILAAIGIVAVQDKKDKNQDGDSQTGQTVSCPVQDHTISCIKRCLD